MKTGASVDDFLWHPPPCELSLDANHVHVWLAALDPGAEATESLCEILSDDERQRAARFRFQKDRDRFIVARSTLRNILARYLHSDPRRLRFEYGEHQKPFIESTRLRFNLSHSHRLALYGVALDKEIGIDIEHIRADFASLDIAERFFSPREVISLKSFPDCARTEAFFNCWTRKEAYIKVRGTGVSHGLENFAVSLDEPARLLSDLSDPQAVSRYSLFNLRPAQEYAGAVAVEGQGLSLKFWQYSQDITAPFSL
jgi:4'-phosphopantetheinyl transferase